ncbi:MAG: HEAT repeat domain-containing protein [Myxococcota bacterium]
MNVVGVALEVLSWRGARRLRTMSRFALTALAALCLVWGEGCSRSPSSVRVRKVLVDVAAGTEGALLGPEPREAVRDVVERVVSGTAGIERSDAREGVVLRVLLEELGARTPARVEDQGGGLRLSVELRADNTLTEDRSIDLRSQVTIPSSHESGSAGTRLQEVESAFRAALTQVLTAHGAGALADEVLVTWLGDAAASRAQRLEACRVLGTRRTQAAGPALVSLLRDDDMELALGALRSLSALGAHSFTDAIIDFAEGKAASVRVQAIEALQDNPEPRVQAWLFTLSTGHPEAEVRGAAERALARLEQAPAKPDSPAHP